MKISIVALIVASGVMSLSVQANESFGIMNDRLGSAIQDNANNLNAQSRVNSAYNDAKSAIGGSMDTSKAPSVASNQTPSGTPQAFSVTDTSPSKTASVQGSPIGSIVGFSQQAVSPNVQTINAIQKTPPVAPSKITNLTPNAVPTPISQSIPTVQAVPQAMPQAVPNKVPQITGASYRAAVTAMQVAQMRQFAAVPTKPTNSVINVAVSTVAPNTTVTATIDGKPVTTTAGAIAAVAPTTQITMPIDSVFSAPARKGGADHNGHNGGNVGHDSRGSDNAHSHAFGGHGYGHDNSKSEGFGGHSHFH